MARVRPPADSSASGSATSSRKVSASSSSRTSGCETTSAGRCSTADRTPTSSPSYSPTYFAAEPTDALRALGYRNYWDGEVARHIPRVWDTATPAAALAAREQGSVAALRRILGDRIDAAGLARADDLATPAYDGLEPDELDQLIADLEPISAALDAAGSR